MFRLGLCLPIVALLTLSGCEDVGPDAGCFEREVEEEFDNPYIRNTCDYASPCERLELLCPGSDESVDCGPDEAIVENPEALECILDVLAEGESGLVSWSATAAEDRGWAHRSRRLWTRGSKGYFASSHQVDLSVDIDGVRYVKLRSRSSFAECRDANTNAGKLRCVMDPWTEVLGVVIPAD